MKRTALAFYAAGDHHFDGLGLLPSHLRCSRRADDARGAADLLLPRALGHGRLSLLLGSRWPAQSAFSPSAAATRTAPQIADAWALAGAEVGVVFCTVVSITGPLWARRAWGMWWTWDARLTTTLVLWLIYVSYLLLRRFAAGPQMQTLAAVLGIFGALDVPIVYMSNRWWRTQHPAPVFRRQRRLRHQGPSDAGRFGWNVLAWLPGGTADPGHPLLRRAPATEDQRARGAGGVEGLTALRVKEVAYENADTALRHRPRRPVPRSRLLVFFAPAEPAFNAPNKEP